eukprot:GHVT01001820.1.p1 GENE.GHVT01001820.1~~GHVT01001820.1.p1  ORF type:complete len:317 (+),score=43.57 GHVT01001820.1:483-1433(+)
MDDLGSDLGSIVHAGFRHVLIPQDISLPVREVGFPPGPERAFSAALRRHFYQTAAQAQGERAKEALRENLKQQVDSQAAGKGAVVQIDAKANTEKLQAEQELKQSDETTSKIDNLDMETVLECSHTYQIIPLVLPTKKNNFDAVNCYIDNIGRIKQLGTNSRATRICGTDIQGDAFISRTFDDEEIFRRVDFGLADYEKLLESPPETKGRWDQQAALKQLMAKTSGSNPENSIPVVEEKKCWNCGRKEADNDETPLPQQHCEETNQDTSKLASSTTTLKMKPAQLLRCGRCKTGLYCNPQCQRADWVFHRRTCLKK